MTQTENYHLPQWEAHDSLRREDFNQAMANIDAALADETQQEQSLARLRRMGYDLYQAAGRSICAGVPGGAMKGTVLNGMKSAEELSRVSGMLHLEGGGCLIGPSTAMTLEKLRAAIYSWENEEALKVLDPASGKVKFKSTFRGKITSLDVWYHRTSYAVIPLPLIVRLYDLEKQEYTYQSGEFSSATLSTETTTETLTVSIPVEENRNYQLELYTRGDAFYGTIGFGAYGSQVLTGTVEGIPAICGTVRESLTLETPAAQVVAVIHYSGGDQAPTATLNGQTMQAKAARQNTSLRGEGCTEQEFVLAGGWSGTLTWESAFQSAGQDMTVYDAGFYLI